MNKFYFRLIFIAAILAMVAVITWLLIRNNILQVRYKPKIVSESTVVQSKSSPLSLSREEQIKRGIESMNTTLQFWGKIVDQNDKPLEGVKIVIRTTKPVWLFRDESSLHTLSSDSSGAFELSGIRGQSLSIEIMEKEGYELSKETRRSYTYTQISEVFTPDSNHPVIFKMWRKGKSEPLIHYEVNRIGVPCDGTPILFDLMTGKKVIKGGDFRVTLIRNPLHIDRKKPYDWKATLEIFDGGLAKAVDEFKYLAPENGYEQLVKIDVPATDPKWISSKEMDFYVKFRKGRCFGRLKISLTTDYEPPPTGFTFEGWINPSNSRNLEYDPNKRISPQRVEEVGLEKAIEEARDPEKRQREYDASWGIQPSGK